MALLDCHGICSEPGRAKRPTYVKWPFVRFGVRALVLVLADDRTRSRLRATSTIHLASSTTQALFTYPAYPLSRIMLFSALSSTLALLLGTSSVKAAHDAAAHLEQPVVGEAASHKVPVILGVMSKWCVSSTAPDVSGDSLP